MASGFLLIEVSTAKGGIPLEGVRIEVESEETGKRIEMISNFEGKVPDIELPTKPRNLSLEEQNSEKPYSEYDVTAQLNGYYEVEIQGVQIFADEHSYLPITLIPEQVVNYDSVVEVADIYSQIDEHNIMAQNTPRNEAGGGPSYNSIYNEVIIPKNITVHLGRPEEMAEDVTVDFRYYVKNVASSEIYPTWPYEALRANIYAIISLALNRVYTEWYKLRGYPFQITNSTSFDQAFVRNRNIFDSISTIVDDVFNEYVRKIGYIEPYFTQYCDGKNVQCEGMKQWGSYDLAREGLNAVEILKYYYGNDIEIATSNLIEDIRESYPGSALRVGDSGKDVYLMQRYLNRISIDFPNIPSTHPQNGIFTVKMEESVKAFQKQFNMVVDGIIGKATWYKIAYIFVSVTDLAELTSEGLRLQEEYLKYPGNPLREGDRGESVYALQVFLAVAAIFYDTIDTPKIDGSFGRNLKNIVIQFQKEFGLTQDGIVGEQTWNMVVNVYQNLVSLIPPMDEVVGYPGAPLRIGSSGSNVSAIQIYLNKIAEYYPSVPRVTVDGRFGNATKQQVEAFQRAFNLNVDGIIGERTWTAIVEAYESLLRVSLYPGVPLAQGDRNESVRKLQEYLQQISQIYSEIPSLEVDGVFGARTREAVRAFQTYFGLTSDGIVGKKTWNKIVEVYINDIREIISEDLQNSTYDAVFDSLSNTVKYAVDDRVGK